MNYEKVLNYRRKHKKCKYCKYLRLDCSGERVGVLPFYICIVKDKIIGDCLPDMTKVRRIFCKCYEADETKIKN